MAQTPFTGPRPPRYSSLVKVGRESRRAKVRAKANRPTTVVIPRGPRKGVSRMSKALFGYLGEPRAYVLLKQIADLKARVAELEKSLEAAEAEVIALRAIAESREEVKALA